MKESDNKDKNVEDQKKCVEIFAKDNVFNSQRGNMDPNFSRREIFFEVLMR